MTLKRITTSISISPDEKHLIDELSFIEKKTRSKIVREALELYAVRIYQKKKAED